MIDAALRLIQGELNEFVARRLGLPLADQRVQTCNIVDDTGKISVPKSTIGISLINIQEDRINQPTPTVRVGGHQQVDRVSTPMKLNLYLLFAANFADYLEALKSLSLILEMFILRPVMSRSDTPRMPEHIDTLRFEFCSQSLDQLKDIWAFLGGRYLPSVIFRVQGAVIQPEHVLATTPRPRRFSFNIRPRLSS